MRSIRNIVLIAFTILFYSITFGQNKTNEELSLTLMKKDSIKVNITHSSKFFRKFEYKYDNDTLILNVKIGFIKRKIESNKVALLPNINFVRLNAEKYVVRFNYQTKFWYLEKWGVFGDHKRLY